jgi:hypothetical protein
MHRYIFFTSAIVGELSTFRACISPPPSSAVTRYPYDRRLDGPYNRSGHIGDETDLTLPGVEPRLLPSPSL